MFFNVFFFLSILGPKVLTPQNGLLLLKFIWRYYSNAFGAFSFSTKKRQIQTKHVYTLWEQENAKDRFTTTTQGDEETNGFLTFFFL